MSPRLENAVVKLALSDAKRRSDAIASTSPPPAATPLTAAMTGLPTRSRKLNSAGSSSSSGSGVAAAGRITLGRAGQVGGVEAGAEGPALTGAEPGSRKLAFSDASKMSHPTASLAPPP